MVTAPLDRSVSSVARYTTCVWLSCSISREKNSTSDMGIPPSTFFNELIEGLTLFFSIIEMVLLVTPARLASSRWERPLSLRIDCSRTPTSNAGILLGNRHGWIAVSWQQCSVFTTLDPQIPRGPQASPRNRGVARA